LCIIGATNFSESLSAPINLPNPIKRSDGTDGLRDWDANLFLAHFFEWILTPRDVDGDGRYTLMDAHKHSSVGTYSILRSLKVGVHAQVSKLQQDILALPQNAPPIQAQALKQMHQDALKKLYLINQDPWVLHSLFAADITFALGAPAAPAPAMATAGATP
jgi:hypothetical protein